MSETSVEIAGRTVRLSSLDRVLWPATGTTKAELIEFYVRVAPQLLPQVTGRPLTLHRFPEGVGGPHFYQTRTPPHPDWVRTAMLSFEKTGKVFEAPVIDDVAGLVWAGNITSLEVHPFLALAESLHEPTHLVVDLDPGPPAGLVDACRVALRARDVLGVDAVVATTGGKGLHVFVRVPAGSTYDVTKATARELGRVLTRDDPAGVTDRMVKADRPGKVLVDWSQNDAGKTTLPPWSPRAYGATPTLSMPVTWDEVAAVAGHGDPRPLRFRWADVGRRLAEHGDLAAPLVRARSPGRRGPAVSGRRG